MRFELVADGSVKKMKTEEKIRKQLIEEKMVLENKIKKLEGLKPLLQDKENKLKECIHNLEEQVDCRTQAERLINKQLHNEIEYRRRTERVCQTIIHTTLDGFWIADKQGFFMDVNDSYCKLIGYSRNELLKMNIKDIEALESPEEVKKHIQKIIESGGDRFKTQHRCKDGRIVEIEVSANYLKEEGQFFVFLRDITERKKQE